MVLFFLFICRGIFCSSILFISEVSKNTIDKAKSISFLIQSQDNKSPTLHSYSFAKADLSHSFYILYLWSLINQFPKVPYSQNHISTIEVRISQEFGTTQIRSFSIFQSSILYFSICEVSSVSYQNIRDIASNIAWLSSQVNNPQ